MKYRNFDYHYEGNKILRDTILLLAEKLPSTRVSVTADVDLGDNGSPDFFYVDVHSNYEDFRVIYDFLNDKKLHSSFCHYEDEFLDYLTDKLLEYFKSLMPDYSFSHSDDYLELVVTHNKELTVQLIKLDFEFATDVFESEIRNPKENITAKFQVYIDTIINQIKTTDGI